MRAFERKELAMGLSRLCCLLVFALVMVKSQAQVRITEFMANNGQTLQDDFGQYSDWIEIGNLGAQSVDLGGWSLTDSAQNLSKWVLPSTNLPPSGFLVVFASGRDRRLCGAPLHSNFKLNAAGDYLALVRPDGTIATEFAPKFPAQLPDVSYGFGLAAVTNSLVTTNSTGRVLVPSSAVPADWAAREFSDAAWAAATNGIGFETGQGEEPGIVADQVLAGNPAGYWRLDEMGVGAAVNAGWIAGSGDGQWLGATVAGVPGPIPPSFPGFESTNLAARFNGTDARIEVPFTPDLNPSAAFTVEAWARPARTGPRACAVSSLTVSGASRAGYALYQDYDAPNQWEFIMGNGGGYIARAYGGVVNTNAWQYLAGVYDGLTARLYVNGVLAAVSTLSSAFEPNTSQKFLIGGRVDPANPYYFAGDVDEVAVFGRALTPAEITNRYALATRGVPPTDIFNYADLIRTDLRGSMFNANSSALLRLPFNLARPEAITRLTLRVRYDDGFAACLNGGLVVADNAPADLAWNSAALGRRSTADALQFRSFDLTPALGYLLNGSNVLALQGLNSSAANADFLLQAELLADSSQYQTEGQYFMQPTPGSANVGGVLDLGPTLKHCGFSPAVPGTNDSITVTCQVAQAFSAVSQVSLHWRVMFDPIQQSTMYDDGLHGDGAAGDGIYGAIITNRLGTNWVYTAGQMVRWYVTALDVGSNQSRWPLFTDPLASAEYDGTIIQPDAVTSLLPVFHLFVDPANFSGMDSESGARGSIYYDGEFYDNMYIELRGNTTAYYNKKSHRIEFNAEHPFRHPGPGGRVAKSSLMAEFADPSYLRQHLSYWLLDQAGVPAAFHYPVRLQRNGSFYQLCFHNEVLGADQLDRLGYDKNGALYKAAGTVTTGHGSTGGFQKLLPRTNLTSTVDFDAMAAAISESQTAGRRLTNAFELLNLPEIVNYLAVARWTQEGDDVWANMSLYRDTFGSGEWSVIPFDLNVSWGQLYYADRPADFSYINATNDYLKSHPLYGGSQVQQAGSSSWNRLYDVIIAVPQTRQMLLRRMRTLLDQLAQPPGTTFAQGIFEQHICAMTNLFWAEAHLDRRQWGWPPNSGMYGFGPNQWLTNGVKDLINQFVIPRRQHFFGTHCATNLAKPIGVTWQSNAGIPATQPMNALLSIASIDLNPISGNQDEEYLCLTNPNNFAVDLSGWRMDGGIHHHFKAGTVIPPAGSLYLSPNAAAFRARTAAPHGGMGLFVQGNYSGHLNVWGESLALIDPAGRLVTSNYFAGNPSLAQRYLRITEIMYNPAPAPALNSDAQQFEYLELRNTSSTLTLNLNGVQFTAGVLFSFTGSAVTNLAPGQTVLVVRNAAAFASRYGAGLNLAGEFAGALDNAGEILRLQDAAGEKILEFAYDNRWHPITDGLGFSLVIVDESAPWDTWGLKPSWRPSSRLDGSPGSLDPAAPDFPPIRINEALTHSDPGSDWIELYNPGRTSADLSGWFLTDDFFTPKRYRLPEGTVIAPGECLVVSGPATFELGPSGFRLSEYGEQVHLFSGDGATNLTGYCQGFDFGAAPNGVSFGRYVTSQGEEVFVLQSANTPGATNAPPRVGPVVISEIMYHPLGGTNGSEEGPYEFIELQNLTSTNIPLCCTFTNEPGYGLWAGTNTWHLRQGVDFVFPPNTTLAAASRMLITGFDPFTNATQLAAFRAGYGVPANVPILGPWSGRLDNGGETIELMVPDKPDVTATNLVVPYVLIDKVSYKPAVPWPSAADGLGSSLQRHILAAYGNDPTNWVAALPTAGGLAPLYAQPVILAISVQDSAITISALAAPGFDCRLEWTDNLDQPDWAARLPWIPSNGGILVFPDTSLGAPERFYRVQLR